MSKERAAMLALASSILVVIVSVEAGFQAFINLDRGGFLLCTMMTAGWLHNSVEFLSALRK